MDQFESTVNKMLKNVEDKDVNKEYEEDGLKKKITINEDGNLSRIDNAYLILYATDENIDSGREFVGHIIKRFLENDEKRNLKKFLRDLLNTPTRLHNNSYMHYFSINLVSNPEKVELLEDLIKLGGDIAVEEIGKVEKNKDANKIDEIKKRLKKFVINNGITKKYNDQQIVKAVGESPIRELPDELERKILSQINLNIGGRKKNKKKKSLKKNKKTKRKSLKKKRRRTKRKGRK